MLMLACTCTSTCVQLLDLCHVCSQGADEAIFALATILLLLARDPVMLPMLSEARRYAPYAAAVGCYLGASSLLQMLPGGSQRASQQAWWARLGDVGGLLLAAPQHYLFTQVRLDGMQVCLQGMLGRCAPGCIVHPRGQEAAGAAPAGRAVKLWHLVKCVQG